MLRYANKKVNKSSRINSRNNVTCVINEFMPEERVMNNTKTVRVKPAKIDITELVADKCPMKPE